MLYFRNTLVLIFFISAVMASFFYAGCSNKSNPFSRSALNVEGCWEVYTMAYGEVDEDGPNPVEFQQSGNNLFGTNIVNGLIDGNSISFTVVANDGNQVSYRGEVSENTATGTWFSTDESAGTWRSDKVIIDLNGIWAFSMSGLALDLPWESIVFIQENDRVMPYYACGVPLPCSFDIRGNYLTAVCGSLVLSDGTIDCSGKSISGVIMDQQGGGFFTLERTSPSVNFGSDGTVIINGDFCDNPVNINSDTVCAWKNMEGNDLTGIEIYTEYNGEQFGFNIESADQLNSNTTYNIENGFVIELKGPGVEDCYDVEDGKPASSGTVSIDVYDGSRLEGRFRLLTFQGGYTLTGSFDVTL